MFFLYSFLRQLSKFPHDVAYNLSSFLTKVTLSVLFCLFLFLIIGYDFFLLDRNDKKITFFFVGALCVTISVSICLQYFLPPFEILHRMFLALPMLIMLIYPFLLLPDCFFLLFYGLENFIISVFNTVFDIGESCFHFFSVSMQPLFEAKSFPKRE